MNDEKKTPIRGAVTACYHMGCRWKELQAENARLLELVKVLQAAMNSAKQQIAKSLELIS